MQWIIEFIPENQLENREPKQVITEAQNMYIKEVVKNNKTTVGRWSEDYKMH